MRIATDFAENGTLYYAHFNGFFRETSKAAYDDETDKPVNEGGESFGIPLAFAWRIWIALVDAAIRLKKANIIHLDLHPDNIFFSPDDADNEVMGRWGFKPQAGDFGWAMPINSSRSHNPSDFDIGAPRLRTPEQHLTDPPLLGLPNDKITGRTSVFQIAVMMHTFLNNGVLAFPGIVGRTAASAAEDNEDPFWPHLKVPDQEVKRVRKIL